ncbi:MAG: ABC transporter substrate-binding protein [Sphaerochaetaceae bacterium]|jgi:branched-chain amino acid transport system substrate-binding protein|nr:ABC transporter substrate-binding protein [Sphaerochaetaceae bacterium]MDD3941077.1 ABC transporter substrate-binding protein [Sphaerochaetaceae bacterium]MDX9939974.1 ABC transporter substrate-binding protein [Sphaerochaetaceae bacterium]
MKRIVVFVLIALLACQFLFAGGKAESAGGEKEIVIGVFEPQTGENGGGGFQEVLGIRYANKVYPTVTVGGETYKVRLVEADNKSDKTEAVTAAQSLISSGASVIIGSYGSGVSIAAGDIFLDNQVPAIGASCTNPQVTFGNDYYFRVCFLDPFQGTVMANYAWQEGAKKAAVITQLGDDYSSGLGNFFKRAFLQLGGNVVSEQQFQTNTTDFKSILTNIKAANPDVIFAPSSIATAPLIIKQARELGITAKIMAGDTWENSSIIENAGASAEGVVLSTFFDDADPATEEAAKFITGFKSYLVENKQPDIIPAVSALGYDAYLVALEAIKAANSTKGPAIRDALVDVSVEGVTGKIVFDENGDADKDLAFIKVIKDGQFKFLKTVSVL